MQKARRRRTLKTSPFILKLHQMLENAQNSHLISWTHDQSAFIIRHPFSFSTNVLPKYYRHSNYSSFLRQLNLYSFVKKRSDSAIHVFHHPLFSRGDFQKHRLIKRIEQQSQLSSKDIPEEEESMGMVLGEGIGLEEKIGVIRRKQKRLREACERLISENQEIISDNFIFKATLEDESSNDRIILDRISAFIMDYHQNGNLDYCDSNMVKGLLKFLENNNWEEFIPKRTPTALAQFFSVIENNELRTAVKWMSSLKVGERKKKNFTIVNGKGGEGGMGGNNCSSEALTIFD